MGSVISHSSSFDHYIHVVVSCQTGVHHLLRSFNLHRFDISRRIQHRRPRNQRHLGTAVSSGLRDSITHLTAGAVADIPYRVDRLAGTGSSYQNTQIFHIATTSGKESFDKFHDLTRLRQTSRTRSTTGQKAYRRGHHSYAMLFQAGNIFLRQSIFIHTCIHRRTDDDRCLSGQ